MRLITASHITDWANRDRRDCQGMLPLLVRHLVRATAERIDLIDFPAGDAVSDAGWDGRLQCASSCAFVPDAASGWEIGTDKSAPGKAASDYAKRSADPLDLAPSQAKEGFISGVINARGVTVRGPHDGGKLERIEQNLYNTWASGIRATSPRTARILDQLAEHYRIDAVREDAAADLNTLR